MGNWEHRKSTVRVRILNSDGTPAAQAKAAFQQTSHEFLFGSGAFDSLPATAGDPFYQDRVEKWVKLFNYGTIPFYWGGFEPVEGQPETASRMNAAKYLQSKGARVKGHPLCWHTVCAPWLLEYDNATILDKQINRIHRDVAAFRGVVDMWDVINEVVIMPEFDRYDNAVTRLCQQLGRVKLVKTVFDAAKEANPVATLLINDFNLSERYRDLIAECLDAGVPISAIGLQTHQHQGYMGRERLEEVLERFSVFGLPLHFTENTLVSGQIMPPHIVDLNDYQVESWPSTPEGEERQKNEWLEMYDILFSHPLVEAVTGWDFADGAWLHAPSGLIREDNSLKPSYLALKEQIHGTWTTREELTTDERGYVTLTGFRGSYQVNVDGKTAEFKISKDCGTAVVVLG